MNILFVAPCLVFGGAERVMSLLANEFASMGHNVRFILLSDPHNASYYLSSKVSLSYIGQFDSKKPSYVFKYIKKLRGEIFSNQPDVAVCFFNHCATFTRWATIGKKIPIVFSERNDPQNNIVGFSSKIFQKLAIKYSDALVFQTKGAMSHYVKYKRKLIEVILNPFSTLSMPDYYDGVRDRTIVSVGRLSKQKNHALLIKAFSKVIQSHPEYKLVIYGEGPLRSQLISLIQELELNDSVLLAGVSNNIFSEIKSAGIFAFSSDYEGLPNALLEAMALGLPCVSTDCSPGGARELITNYENGIVVPCNDIKALSSTINYLIEHPDEATKMGDNAKHIVKRLDVKLISQKWLSLMEDVIQMGN